MIYKKYNSCLVSLQELLQQNNISGDLSQDIQVFDFDKVSEQYKSKNKRKSCDCLILHKNKYYLIEFKNYATKENLQKQENDFIEKLLHSQILLSNEVKNYKPNQTIVYFIYEEFQGVEKVAIRAKEIKFINVRKNSNHLFEEFKELTNKEFIEKLRKI